MTDKVPFLVIVAIALASFPFFVSGGVATDYEDTKTAEVPSSDEFLGPLPITGPILLKAGSKEQSSEKPDEPVEEEKGSKKTSDSKHSTSSVEKKPAKSIDSSSESNDSSTSGDEGASKAKDFVSEAVRIDSPKAVQEEPTSTGMSIRLLGNKLLSISNAGYTKDINKVWLHGFTTDHVSLSSAGFSNSDGFFQWVCGHNPGHFASIVNLSVGDSFELCDSSGLCKTYTIYKVEDADRGKEYFLTPEIYFSETTILQTCTVDNWVRLFFAK